MFNFFRKLSENNRKVLAYVCCILGTVLFFLVNNQEYKSPSDLYKIDIIGTIFGFSGLGLWLVGIKLFLSIPEKSNFD